MYLFRILGFLIGFRLLQFQGALAGFILGYALDASLQNYLMKQRMQKAVKRRMQYESNQIFFNSLFSMLAKLARADGVISKEEIFTVEQIMDEVLRLGRKEKKIAREIFNKAKDSGGNFSYHAAQFYEVFHAQPPMLEGLVNFLFRLAASDGTIKIEEERLIYSAAQIFGMPDPMYAQIRRSHIPDSGYSQSSSSGSSSRSSGGSASAGPQRPYDSTKRAYAALGCEASMSDDEIRSRYRKLVADFHPDKILSKGLAEEFTTFATEKFREIQSAYEEIKRVRGMS